MATEQKVMIVNEKPPVWDAVCAMIGSQPIHAIFAWGDRIYNPAGQDLPQFLIAHEMHHMTQQALVGGPEAWWDRYLNDPYFRIQQETEAYAVQYLAMCAMTSDRNRRFKFLTMVGESLSGPLYGSMITKAKARSMINAQIDAWRKTGEVS